MRLFTILTILFELFIFEVFSSGQSHHPSDSLTLINIDLACDTGGYLNWNTESDPDHWDGITWSSYVPKRVIEIYIPDYFLTGILNVSSLDALEWLICRGSYFTEINVSGLNKLEFLSLTNNLVTHLDLSTNPNLRILSCGINPISELDVSMLNELEAMYCGNTSIEVLDVSGKIYLDQLNCENSEITNLNLSGCNSLMLLRCNNNNLTNLDVNETALRQLYCNDNQITNLSISDLNPLGYIDCSNNQIEELTLSGLDELRHLDCHTNQLSFLDLNNLDRLEYLDCATNQIASLQLPADTVLNYLNCSGNELSDLDLSSQLYLSTLDCSDNLLTSLVLPESDTLKSVNCRNNALENITLFSAESLKTLDCAGNKLPFSELMKGVGVENFVYSPQDTLYDFLMFEADVTMDFSKEAVINDSPTTFHLFKYQFPIDSNQTGILRTTGPGMYYSEMANDLFPDLTLRTAHIKIYNVPAYLAASDSEIFLSANDTTFNVDIFSNTIWHINTEDAWLSARINDGVDSASVLFEAEENTSSERTTSVSISANGTASIMLTVTQQSKPGLWVSETSENSFRMFPNPTNGLLYLVFNGPANINHVQIYSYSGNLVFSQQVNDMNNIKLDLTNYPPGIYFLQWRSDRGNGKAMIQLISE